LFPTVAVEYFFNNDLEFLKSSDPEKNYTMSIMKTKAARYEIVGIEDMVPTLWSTIKFGYNKDVEKGIKHWGEKCQRCYTSLKMLKRHIDDLQLGVESYQKKLNITEPQKTFPGIEYKELYTPSYKPTGVIYEDLNKQKRVMRADELYSSMDGDTKGVVEERGEEKEEKEERRGRDGGGKGGIPRESERSREYMRGGGRIGEVREVEEWEGEKEMMEEGEEWRKREEKRVRCGEDRRKEEEREGGMRDGKEGKGYKKDREEFRVERERKGGWRDGGDILQLEERVGGDGTEERVGGGREIVFHVFEGMRKKVERKGGGSNTERGEEKKGEMRREKKGRERGRGELGGENREVRESEIEDEGTGKRRRWREEKGERGKEEGY
ncbi:hypothetical protein Tco_0603818, partial [Tanacetum coccineum]